MDAEFSTHPEKSQELSKRPKGPNLAFYWLVISALLWGTPIILSLYIPLALLELLLPKSSRIRDALCALRQKIFSGGIYLYLRMQKFFNTHYELDELRKLERAKEKFLIVSNHRSHLDVFLYISKIDGLQLIAKKALFKVPVLNIMMKLTRQIPAEKGDWKSFEFATQIMHERIKQGERLLVFPEFKRCESGFIGINGYSALPFQIAMKEEAKILPLVVYGTDEVWPKGSLSLKASKQKQYVVALEVIDSNSFSSAKDLRDKVLQISENKLKELAAREP